MSGGASTLLGNVQEMYERPATFPFIMTGNGPSPGGMLSVTRVVIWLSGPYFRSTTLVTEPGAGAAPRPAPPAPAAAISTGTMLSSLGLGGIEPMSYICSSLIISARRAFQSSAVLTIWPSRNFSGSGRPLILG